MKKKAYRTPLTDVLHISGSYLLTGTTEELRFDPHQGTDEALVKHNNVNYNVWNNDWSNN